MPERIPRLCLMLGCDELVDSGYCNTHANRKYDRQRGNSNSRGYNYRWRTFRLHYLSRHPVCVDCYRAEATEVHHIQKLADNPELKFVHNNLMALCAPCHKFRTSRGE